MLVTPSEMFTLASDVQPRKASLPISVTLDGMLTLATDVQPQKAPGKIIVTLAGIVTLVIFSPPIYKSAPLQHGLNADDPKFISNHCSKFPP